MANRQNPVFLLDLVETVFNRLAVGIEGRDCSIMNSERGKINGDEPRLLLGEKSDAPSTITLFHDGKPATSSYRLMIKRALEGLDLEVWGDPQKGMDLIYVKDFCQMVWRQLFADVDKSGMYNVGTGRMTSLDELVSTIIEVFAKDTSTSKKVYRPEKHDCVNYFMNVDKARKNLGYEPQYGPRELFEDYKREMELNRFAGFFSERYGDASAYR